MPGLDRSIVEHRLPIKSGFKPYKQPPRKLYKDEVLADVKKEVERLLVLTVKIRQPSHEFTFGVGMSFIPYPLVLTPVV
jgi:hypothetical protein